MPSSLFHFVLAPVLVLSVACQHAAAPVTPGAGAADISAAASTSTTSARAGSGYDSVPPASSPETRYVFGWGELPAKMAEPRGGSTTGAPVTLAPARALPLPEIAAAPDAFSRDRAAILALAGDYRVSFHFMESLGLTMDYQPARPYYSWATEQVRVIEDTVRFISLQHVLVMVFQMPDGTRSEPMVMKHWRQDWTYEDDDLHTFRGDNTWARRRPLPEELAGAWSQAVFQVDDSPRYEALGRWEHRGNVSMWTSERAWRPLPRREDTVRDDYGVMEGIHRMILTPTGWLHEQHNWKRVAGESENPESEPRMVAAELGLDRYERITAPSLAAADDYWLKTSPYWAAVRRTWADILTHHDRFSLRADVAGRRLYEEHFEFAEKVAADERVDPAEIERHARATIKRYVRP